MPTKQGDVSLLQDPVAQELLQSQNQARLAYVWHDGTPRVVPIWFHWNGKEIVLSSPPIAPKMKALQSGVKVALTIDSPNPPWKVLLVRGTVRTDIVDGMSPEYATSAYRYLGQEQGKAWLETAEKLARQWARIFVTPEWVGILDFERRFPSALEKAMEEAGAGG